MAARPDRAAAKQQALAAFTAADAAWAGAMRGHQLAPPDLGFAGRLRDLAEASRRRAEAARIGNLAGLRWVPVEGARNAQVPYELRPGTGRRGPQDLWRAFDAAVLSFNVANEDTDLGRLAEAADALSKAADNLAQAVEGEDGQTLARLAAGR